MPRPSRSNASPTSISPETATLIIAMKKAGARSATIMAATGVTSYHIDRTWANYRKANPSQAKLRRNRK